MSLNYHKSPSLLVLTVAALTLNACSFNSSPGRYTQIHQGMKPEQVQAILGRPARIEQSATTDQSLTGEVDYYPAPTGEGRVVYLNNVVFKSESVAAPKS